MNWKPLAKKYRETLNHLSGGNWIANTQLWKQGREIAALKLRESGLIEANRALMAENEMHRAEIGKLRGALEDIANMTEGYQTLDRLKRARKALGKE